MGEIKCVYCGADISGRGVHCPECGKYADGVRRISTYPISISIVVKIRNNWLHIFMVLNFIVLYYYLPFLCSNRAIVAVLQAIIHIVLTVLLIFLAPIFLKELKRVFPFLKYDD